MAVEINMLPFLIFKETRMSMGSCRNKYMIWKSLGYHKNCKFSRGIVKSASDGSPDGDSFCVFLAPTPQILTQFSL